MRLQSAAALFFGDLPLFLFTGAGCCCCCWGGAAAEGPMLPGLATLLAIVVAVCIWEHLCFSFCLTPPAAAAAGGLAALPAEPVASLSAPARLRRTSRPLPLPPTASHLPIPGGGGIFGGAAAGAPEAWRQGVRTAAGSTTTSSTAGSSATTHSTRFAAASPPSGGVVREA